MPVLRRRAKVSPEKQMQPNGLYVHSSPPRVLNLSSAHLRQLIRAGDIERLIKIVYEGQGKKLIGETSSDHKVKNFLKAVPAMMSKISQLHDAVNSGKIEEMKAIIEEDPDKRKRMVYAKDEAGVGLLHKAVYYDLKDIVAFLTEHFPQLVTMKDSEGRTPYHYTPMCKDIKNIQKMLIGAGADASALDHRQHSAKYYTEHVTDLELPSAHQSVATSRKSTASKEGLVIKKSNIRIWIHQRDIGQLQKVIWEGHASKLLVEHSNSPKVKKFLEVVPHIMGLIKDIHTDVQNNDLTSLTSHSSPPVPPIALTAKDVHGLTPLHKAAGLGRQEVAEYIVEKYPNSVLLVDAEGKTPLHYSALLKDNAKMFNFLLSSGADESALDNRQKTAAYYKNRPSEIDQKFLQVVPECPRGAKDSFLSSFDWSLLAAAIPLEEKMVKKIETIFGNGTDKTEETKTQDAITNGDEASSNLEEEKVKNLNYNNNIEIVEIAEEYKLPPELIDDTDEVVAPEYMEEAEQFPQYIDNNVNDNNNVSNNEDTIDNLESEKTKPNLEIEAKPESEIIENNNNRMELEEEEEKEEEEEEEEKEKEEEEEEENEKVNTDNTQKEETIHIFEPENEKEEVDNEYVQNGVDSSIESGEEPEMQFPKVDEPDDEGVIEGVVNGENEIESLNENGQDTADEENKTEDPEITNLIEAGNMEQLAALVLNGEGERLIGQQSENPELQAFLDNVPTYMNKIKRIHVAAREGSLKDLQAALDRRKFAIAKDKVSPNSSSPLHVATVFGNTSIVRYLAGRFPETLQAVDNSGRTALHYAALLADNGHYYNLLLHLGGEPRAEDKFGRTPEYYRENQDQLSHRTLLGEFGAEEGVVEEILNDKDKQASNNQVDMPFFYTEEGRYLASSLGDPLIKGLTEVATKRPKDPIAYLATYLYNFANNSRSQPKTQENQRAIIIEEPERLDDNKAVPASIDVVTLDPEDDNRTEEDSAFNSTSRDEHGQSMLHFAAARSHGRNALFQLLQETEINVGYRDELYRTARDISIQANIPENTMEIDKYVMHIASKGDTDKLVELLLDGYDHIIDLVDDEGTPIIDAVAKKEQTSTVAFLQSVLAFEEKRERVHHAIRGGSLNEIKDLLADENETGSGKLLAMGKNSYGRCSLHIAVLCQQEEIVDFLASSFSDTLFIGDNLERTALHYAMGIQKIESISKVLIKSGARRVVKDLKGRQPTYYFMNKSDILRLQEEEETF